MKWIAGVSIALCIGAAAGPARARGVQSMIWQYRMNCFVPVNDRYGVDLDYAAQAAFSEMW